MLKAYKYRIYPNSEQRIQIAKTFGCCRFVYNQTLAYRKDIYEKEKKSVSKTDCNNYCNRELKKNYEWLKEADKFALTNAIYNMDAAYQNFFKEHAGFPKFKSKHDNHKSYTTNYINGNITVNYENGKIKLPKLKEVKQGCIGIIVDRLSQRPFRRWPVENIMCPYLWKLSIRSWYIQLVV